MLLLIVWLRMRSKNLLDGECRTMFKTEPPERYINSNTAMKSRADQHFKASIDNYPASTYFLEKFLFAIS